MRQYVIYLRVSGAEQGRSGLGLAAQERDVNLYLSRFAEEPWEVIGRFVEVQSGADDDRPELQKALAMVRKAGANCELLIAKLDRLSRRVSYIATLMEDRRVKLRVASMPDADPLQMHIYAAFAEQERKFISARTKAALAETKAKGAKLGGLRDKTGKRNAAVQAEARDRAESVAPMVRSMRADGRTLQEIADALNAAGVTTARGAVWYPAQVQRTLKRLSTVEIDVTA